MVIGPVQYYQNIWDKISEVIASLKKIVRECGHAKVTKKKYTEKKMFNWELVNQ